MKRLQEERGVALVAALMVLALMGALGGAIVLATTIEMTLAGNYRRAEVGHAAAEAMLARVLVDLAAAPDWTPVLAGERLSSFVDGPPSGGRLVANSVSLDLGALENMANCGRIRPCTAAELTRITARRPWGANNPVWRLFAYGELDTLVPGIPPAGVYVIAMVGDDTAETDGDPLIDGGSGAAGEHHVMVRAEAFGLRGLREGVQVAVARDAGGRLRVKSWTDLARGSTD